MIPSLILASTSPRRRELLALTGLDFEVKPAAIDESPVAGEPPAEYVVRLAVSKARWAARFAGRRGQRILAADTIVADGLKLLGKPSDFRQAVAMLEQLRGHVHQVYTAIALLEPASDTLLTDLCASQVPMRSYSTSEIESYAASGDALDKAGAYAIQHAGFHPVEEFAGCFANVMGLPLCHLVRTFQRADLSPPVEDPAALVGVEDPAALVGVDVAQACQAYLVYRCPVFQSVLNGENVG